MSSNKVFKTLDEQVDILRSKGLIVSDVEKTKEILLRENYFLDDGAYLVTKIIIELANGNDIENTNANDLFMYELTDFLFPLACSLTIVGINDVAIPVAKAVMIAHILGAQVLIADAINSTSTSL